MTIRRRSRAGDSCRRAIRGGVQAVSDVGVDSSLAVFHEVRLGVSELDLVGGADAGEEGAVDGGRKELRGGFAREEDSALDGHPDLPAQALLGADRHVGVRAEFTPPMAPARERLATTSGYEG